MGDRKTRLAKTIFKFHPVTFICDGTRPQKCYKIKRRIDCKEGGKCLAQAGSFAQRIECTPWILYKIFLAGLHDLLYVVTFNRLSWA